MIVNHFGSTGWRQIGFIGDAPNDLRLGLLSDADFAGDRASMRSTSGVFLALYGYHCFSPLSGQSRKHTAVSHSTVEAEIVASDHAIRTSGLPALQLWERLLDRPLQLDVYQDNQATGRTMSTGRAPTLRHIGRTHRVSVAWIHERVSIYTIVYRQLWPPINVPSMLYVGRNGFQCADLLGFLPIHMCRISVQPSEPFLRER